jgi:hypothetical protein
MKQFEKYERFVDRQGHGDARDIRHELILSPNSADACCGLMCGWRRVALGDDRYSGDMTPDRAAVRAERMTKPPRAGRIVPRLVEPRVSSRRAAIIRDMTQRAVQGEDDRRGHVVEIAQRPRGARGDDAAYWRCSCGASAGGRWYSSSAQAQKAADRHLKRSGG